MKSNSYLNEEKLANFQVKKTSPKLFKFNSRIILSISVCDDFGLLKEIFKFPISAAEENEFMSYLDESSSRDAGDLKIMYLLSRGR